jgi:hypothetical protein
MKIIKSFPRCRVLGFERVGASGSNSIRAANRSVCKLCRVLIAEVKI